MPFVFASKLVEDLQMASGLVEVSCTAKRNKKEGEEAEGGVGKGGRGEEGRGGGRGGGGEEVGKGSREKRQEKEGKT